MVTNNNTWQPYHHLGREVFPAPVWWQEDGWFTAGEKEVVLKIRIGDASQTEACVKVSEERVRLEMVSTHNKVTFTRPNELILWVFCPIRQFTGRAGVWFNKALDKVDDVWLICTKYNIYSNVKY